MTIKFHMLFLLLWRYISFNKIYEAIEKRHGHYQQRITGTKRADKVETEQSGV
jgi:hypothetical protein